MMRDGMPHQAHRREPSQSAITLDPTAPPKQLGQREQPKQAPRTGIGRLSVDPRSHIVLSLVIFALSLGVCLYQTVPNSVWLDEAYSVGLSQLSWSTLWSYVWGIEAHTGLYYVALRGWIWLAGTVGVAPTELVVRLPSLICVALSAVIVYQFGRRFLSFPVGIVGASLFLMNFLVLVQGDEARNFGVQLLFVCASWYALVAALTNWEPRRWWIAYVALGTLQIYAEAFSLVIIGAQVATFVCLFALRPDWRARVRSSVVAMTVSLACIFLLTTPILYDVLLHGSGNGWIPPAHPSDLVALIGLLGGGITLLAPLLLAIGVIELAIPLLAHRPATAHFASRLSWLLGDHTPPLLRRPTARSADLPIVVIALVCWLALPILIAYFITQPYLNAHIFNYLYFAVCAPAYCLLAGLCIAVTRWQFVQVILVVVLITFSLRVLPTAQSSANYGAWRDPAVWLEQHYQVGDGVVCVPDTWCAIPLDYYFLAYPSQAHLDPNSPGAWDWEGQTSNPTSAEALASYASQHDRIFLVTYDRTDFGAASPQRQQVDAVRFWLKAHAWQGASFTSSTYLATITVTLYTRAPPGNAARFATTSRTALYRSEYHQMCGIAAKLRHQRERVL